MVSVRLNEEKCKGCTTCVKLCPVEAIRVRNGRAVILRERCIDCGNCVRVCPHHAKVAESDPLSCIEPFKYRIALPAPSLYAQFHNLTDTRIVIAALLSLGFDDVFEPARAAEMISQFTYDEMRYGKPAPVISSACPAVLRLIQLRYQDLLPMVSVYISPLELAAKIARRRAAEQTGLDDSDIGLFFISPCPAKVSAIRDPKQLGGEEGLINGALSMTDIYKKIVTLMEHKDFSGASRDPDLAGFGGVSWATAGGESRSIEQGRAVWADGMDSVIRVLNDLEDGKYPEFDFVELNACPQGCVGGCLTVENPSVAKSRVRTLMRNMRRAEKLIDPDLTPPPTVERDLALRRSDIVPSPEMPLDPDFTVAMQKMRRLEDVKAKLPGLDCGACGAPGCDTFAEDVVREYAKLSDCIFFATGSSYLPPPFRRAVDKGND